MRNINSAFFAKLQEDSIQIVELLELSTTGGRSWKWTSGNETIVSSLADWIPFPGQPASGIEESIDLGVGIVDFTLANSSDTFNSLLRGQELDSALITVRRVFVDTPDLDAMLIYEGRLGEFTHNRTQMSGRMRDKLGGLSQAFPYYTYMDQCVWRFGGTGCAFDTSGVTTSGDIVSSSGNLVFAAASGTLHVDSYGPNRFEYGKFSFLTGTNSGSVRAIFASSGDIITMSHRLPFTSNSGDNFSIYPGCNKRLIEDCKSLYNNSSNFLGFPWIPRQENAF